MKVGSLVECVGGADSSDANRRVARILKTDYNYVFPVIKGIYVVRGFMTLCGEIGVLLEEIINPVANTVEGKKEIGFLIDEFRGIQPPMQISLSALLSETKQLETV